MKLSTIAAIGILMAGIAGAPALAVFETILAPGDYMVTVSPAITEQAADRIEDQLDAIKGLGSNDAKPKDSTVHFTVKDNARVDLARVKDAISAVIANAKISDPMVAAEDAKKTY